VWQFPKSPPLHRVRIFRLRADGSVVWTISQPPAMGAVMDVQWRYGRHLIGKKKWVCGSASVILSPR
jgi:hypothetical protein